MQYAVDFERLEVRTPLSAGFTTSLAARSGALAPPDLPSQAATTITYGPPVWLGGSSPAARPAAAAASIQSDTSPAFPVYGPPGLSTFLTGGEGPRALGLSDANAPWASTDPPSPGGFATRDGDSVYSVDSYGPSYWTAPSWTGDSMRSGARYEFAAYSNEGNNFFGPNAGQPDPFAALTWTLNIDVIVSPSAGPIGVGDSAHGLAPGGDLDFAPRDVNPSLFFEPDNFGPALDVFGPEDAFDFGAPAARGVVPRLETSGTDTDPTLGASPSASQMSAIASVQVMAIPMPGGRATSVASIQSGGGLASQVDRVSDPVGGGWMSYVVGGDLGSGSGQPGSSLDDWMTATLNTDDGSPAAITDGSAPLSVLLNGPDVPSQTTNDDLEQVAELLPPSESSLALVGTLWSVPSDSSNQDQADQRFDASPPWLMDAATTAPWTAYVVGLDQAFEQSSRQISQFDPTAERRLTPSQRERVELERQLEWERPVVPMATGWVSDRSDMSPSAPASDVDVDADRAIAADRLETPHSQQSSVPAVSSDGEGTAARSEPASFLTVVALPLLSALSASTALTGWLWTRRHRKRRLGLLRVGTQGS